MFLMEDDDNILEKKIELQYFNCTLLFKIQLQIECQMHRILIDYATTVTKY